MQWDFLDTYQNLTIKSIMSLKWASQNCKEAAYVVKMDDDIFVNPPNLARLLDEKRLTFDLGGFNHNLDARTVVRFVGKIWFGTTSRDAIDFVWVIARTI